MGPLRKRSILILLGTVPIVADGCHDVPKPASPTTNLSEDPAEQPLPQPEEGLAYVKAALKDKTRVIEVFNDQGLDGALDSSGRSNLQKALPTWWKEVEVVSRYPKAGEVPFRITPDMGIRIFAPGSVAVAEQKDGPPIGQPDLQIMIFKARQLSRVVITDPTAGRVNLGVYVIPSTDPMDWVNRLFAGKL